MLSYGQLTPVKTRYRWPVSLDHIASSSSELIEVKCSFKVTSDQVLGFLVDRGLTEVNLF